MDHAPFSIRGFNMCESLLRHSPEQLKTFIRRMKRLRLNTLILHYDYGWKRYQELLLEECRKAGVEIILMTFGPRTFLSCCDWKPQWFARKEDGSPWTRKLECETYPCAAEPECLEAYEYGARTWLRELPPQIRHVHMRAADGIMFCQCERCRKLPEHERWQPFVDCFAKAAQEVRPDLRFETDIYVMRYNIPGNPAAFHRMNNIMYDTFYRAPSYPLDTDEDICTGNCMDYASGHTTPDAATISRYHANRLREWSTAFPGKVYIHENAMMQSYYGTFQHGTSSYLKDLELYRELGLQGVCYEAFEPGFINFEPMFETLAQAMNGEEVQHEMSEIERYLQNHPQPVFCLDPDFPLGKFFKDPFLLEQNRLFREMMLKPGFGLFRRYVDFAFANEERMDPLYIGYGIAKNCLAEKVAEFPDISAEAQDFLSRRKLWDFMEDIPQTKDPREVCKKIIFELMEKGRGIL